MSRTTSGDGGWLTRRQALQLSGSVAVTTALASCDALSTDPDETGGDNGNAGSDKGAEAPMLAEQVEAGDLPPVEERIPEEPLVIEPEHEIGQYGGTWRSYLDGLAAVDYKFYVELGYDSLVRWSPDWTEVIPNLAESWEVEDDGAAYLFHLRPGLKWSDGEPCNADDIVFTIEDFFGNEEIHPDPPAAFSVDGELLSVEKVDDHTVRFVFPGPKGEFLRRMATPDSQEMPLPRHYLEQFHPAYNDNAESDADEAGFSSWVEHFDNRKDRWNNPDRPTLNAWKLMQAVSDADGRAVFERNAYYWKVDPDGSQLPYIDEVTYEIMDLEVALLQTTNGELDLNTPPLTAGVTTVDNKPVLADAREEGGYKFIDGIPGSMNHGVIALNMNHENEALREVFQSRDFRLGLSYAINREEIINVVFQRQGEPWQAAPRPESDFYDEELAKQHIDFDLDTANEYLDSAGYTERDGAGFRMGPDGSRIRFNMDVVTNEPPQIRMMEMIKDTWAEVGVDMQINTIDRTLFYDRKAANQHDASVWTGDGGLYDVDLEPRWYFPYSGESNYAQLWQEWYNSGGDGGEEPPEAARQQMELYDELREAVDQGERADLVQQILDIAKEEFWVIGTVLPMEIYGSVRNDFRNVPDEFPAAWLYPSPGPTRPEQFFIAE